METEALREMDARLRTIEQNVATELGEQRQFRHDIRNWRNSLDGQNAIFQQELLDQSKRIGVLEQYRAKHEAEYAAKIEKIDTLAEIEARIEAQLTMMDEKLGARVASIEHKVQALIIEKAVAKWLVGVIAAVGAVLLELVGKKLGLL